VVAVGEEEDGVVLAAPLSFVAFLFGGFVGDPYCGEAYKGCEDEKERALIHRSVGEEKDVDFEVARSLRFLCCKVGPRSRYQAMLLSIYA